MYALVKRNGLIYALLAMLPLGGIGCSPNSTRDRPLVGGSLHNLSAPFFVAMRRELEGEATKLGVEMSVVDGQSNSAKQTSDVEAAVARGANGIILGPPDENA